MMKNTTENFAELHYYIERYSPAVETALREFAPSAASSNETKFKSSVESVLFSGKTKTLAILTLLGAELFGSETKAVLPAAAAIEFVNASLRVFEDLAGEKRSASVDSGEAISVAVGLLNAAYGSIFVNHVEQSERALAAHAELVECVGASSFCVENDGEINNFTNESNLQTSAFARLSLRVGAILAGADYLELSQISRFAKLFGDACQLCDDSKKEVINSDHQLDSLIDDAKMILVDNFPASAARSCLIQFTEKIKSDHIEF